MVTIGVFAQTHRLDVKEVIDLSETLKLPFSKDYNQLTEHDYLSADAGLQLMRALNAHRKNEGVNKLKEVSTLVNSNSRPITVVTKRKRISSFDLEAFKKNTGKQIVQTQSTESAIVDDKKNFDSEIVVDGVAIEQSVIEQPVIEQPFIEQPVIEQSVIEQPVIEAQSLSVKSQGHGTKSKAENIFSQDDETNSGGKTVSKSHKSSKKKKTTAYQPMEIAKIDNQALKKITAQYQYRDQDDDLHDPVEALKRKRKDNKNQHQFNRPVKKIELIVRIGESVSVAELADQLSLKIVVILKELLKIGVIAQASTILDRDTATLVVEELGHKVSTAAEENPELLVEEMVYQGEHTPRSPVVTIMGHVDHGKTSLLDYIRRARVAAGEAGGITQHIGAYKVATKHGDVTFLDTPGHAAFTAMRARGAQCTDIAVILVAADDGVMPQTKEAISHAKAAGVPIVVAINKMDKPAADLERVKTELSQLDVLPEEWGGDVPFMPLSAKTGQGIEAFLEVLALQAEILELKAYSVGAAKGAVIESSLSKHQGPVSTVLVQQGQLKIGDIIVSGITYGRVRALLDDIGRSVEFAGPSTPVQVIGLGSVVDAGESFAVVSNEKQAKALIDYRCIQQKKSMLPTAALSLENFFAQTEKKKELNVIIKADTHGSAQAIVHSLDQLGTQEVKIKVIAQSVGGISDSDIMLAKASAAIILAFNTRAEKTAKTLADQSHIAIYYFSIIYELLDHVRAAIYGLESPKFKETFVGLAEVRAVFRSSILGNIAGCLVIEGTVRKDLPIRVLRKNVVVFEGKLESLRRLKDDVQEVRAGTECGIGVKDYNDIKEGDQIEVYRMVEVARKPQ